MEKSEITDVSDLQSMTTEELQAELDALYKADGKRLVDAWILDTVWEIYKH